MTEELGRSQRRRKERRRVRWNRTQAISLLLLIFVLPILAFGVAPWAMGSYDSTHHRTIRCHVKDVYSESTSTRSGRGVGASSRQIIFDTSNCNGHLILQNGVYWDNVDELTDSLKTDRDYEFQVGDIEWNLAATPIYTWTKLSPEVQSYRILSEER